MVEDNRRLALNCSILAVSSARVEARPKFLCLQVKPTIMPYRIQGTAVLLFHEKPRICMLEIYVLGVG